MVLCFLSRGYLRSTNCLREIRAALEKGKPLVLVHEADPDKGGGTLAELRSECPEELQAAIFEAGWPMAVWHRIEAFQHVSLKVIAEALLLKTPKYAGETALPLYISGEIRADSLTFAKPVVLWASTVNDGARGLADAVAAAIAGRISITDATPSRLSTLPRSSDGDGEEATHMLLYLNRSTWAGDGAEALAEQVRAARSARLPIVMAHENDAALGGCIFGRFFEVTPRDLLADGLYDDLAVGCQRTRTARCRSPSSHRRSARPGRRPSRACAASPPSLERRSPAAPLQRRSSRSRCSRRATKLRRSKRKSRRRKLASCAQRSERNPGEV